MSVFDDNPAALSTEDSHRLGLCGGGCHVCVDDRIRRQQREDLMRLRKEADTLKALLSEALDAMRESVDGRDGRDDLQLGCPNCDGALPMPHSLGCRIARAVGK